MRRVQLAPVEDELRKQEVRVVFEVKLFPYWEREPFRVF